MFNIKKIISFAPIVPLKILRSMVLEEFNKYAEQMKDKLAGILGVNFVGIEKGNLLFSKTFSAYNYEPTAKFEAEIAKNALQEIKYIDNAHEDSLQEIIITNKEQVHIIYVSKHFDYLIHLIADVNKVNYGLLRIIHNQCFTQLGLTTSFEDVQTELFPTEAPKKVNHFRKLFFS